MVSHFPRLFATPSRVTAPPTQTPDSEGFGERMLDRVREAFCGLHGHDNLLQFGQDRMFLRCVSCGYESPGWELNEPRPIVAAESDNSQHPRVVRTPLADERRIA
jgi:hypothetical protein